MRYTHTKPSDVKLLLSLPEAGWKSSADIVLVKDVWTGINNTSSGPAACRVEPSSSVDLHSLLRSLYSFCTTHVFCNYSVVSYSFSNVCKLNKLLRGRINVVLWLIQIDPCYNNNRDISCQNCHLYRPELATLPRGKRRVNNKHLRPTPDIVPTNCKTIATLFVLFFVQNYIR